MQTAYNGTYKNQRQHWTQVSQHCCATNKQDKLSAARRRHCKAKRTLFETLHQTINTINRVTTLQTLWNSLTIPWQCAALMPMLSGTHSMPVVLVLM